MKYYYMVVVTILALLHVILILTVIDTLSEINDVLNYGVTVQKMQYTDGFVIKPSI